jgi:hypothetical protein
MLQNGMRATQLRLWFASMAYVLICALRRIAAIRQRVKGCSSADSRAGEPIIRPPASIPSSGAQAVASPNSMDRHVAEFLRWKERHPNPPGELLPTGLVGDRQQRFRGR